MKTKYDNNPHILSTFWIKKRLGVKFKLLVIVCNLDAFW